MRETASVCCIHRTEKHEDETPHTERTERSRHSLEKRNSGLHPYSTRAESKAHKERKSLTRIRRRLHRRESFRMAQTDQMGRETEDNRSTRENSRTTTHTHILHMIHQAKT